MNKKYISLSILMNGVPLLTKRMVFNLFRLTILFINLIMNEARLTPKLDDIYNNKKNVQPDISNTEIKLGKHKT
jgi:hypothetical protein